MKLKQFLKGGEVEGGEGGGGGIQTTTPSI